ncbi:MAG: M28 family peptidase, partial [Luteolibacter sp.]
PPQSKALDEVRAHVATQLWASGWATRGEVFERQTPKGLIRFENLRARFVVGGADPWERRVDGLLCAHIDSKLYEDKVFLGADDAASACAAIVVMAEFLAKKKPKQAAAIELVFFDGEEALDGDITPWDGLYGSRHYVNFWRARDEKPKWGILLDMIGHKDLSIRLPSDTPEDLKELVFAAARSEGAEAYFGMAATPIIDDHVPLNFAGIPTVDLIGDFTRSGWWHTAGDKMNIISAESLDISMRVTLRMIDMRLGK